MAYRLEIRSGALRLFKKLPADVQAKILAEAQILKTNPMAAPALKGKYKSIRSLKFNYKGSAYRIAYQVLAQTSTVLIRLAGTRENFYKYLERLVLLTAHAYAVVQEWLKQRPASDSQAVFLNEQGQRLSANGLQWLLRGYSQVAGITASPHQLRHTFARQLREGGMPLPSLSKLLGHAQISTTEIYTAGADPQLAQAYQTAMGHLAQLLPSPPDQPGPLTLQPTPPPPPTPLPVAPPPDWTTWAPDLPPAIRQASLAFVQRRLNGWKPQRQRVHSQRTLGHLSRFWRWQLAQRAINQPQALQLADLQAFQQAQLQAGRAASTINSLLDDLLASLRDLAQQGQPIDPALFRLRYLPRPQSLPRHLSQIDSQRLEQFVQNRLTLTDPLIRLENACFFLLAHTGLRASECLDLLGHDLDLAGQRLIVRQGKGNRDRVVYLSASACQALQAYVVDTLPTLPLLRLPTGQPLTYRWLYQHLTRLGQAAGQIKVTPHQLRHTLATRLLNVGMNVTYIQKLLGHDNLNTTMIYARVLDVTLQAEYQRAMSQIELQQMPLSRTLELVPGWPVPQELEPLPHFESAEAISDNFS